MRWDGGNTIAGNDVPMQTFQIRKKVESPPGDLISIQALFGQFVNVLMMVTFCFCGYKDSEIQLRGNGGEYDYRDSIAGTKHEIEYPLLT